MSKNALEGCCSTSQGLSNGQGQGLTATCPQYTTKGRMEAMSKSKTTTTKQDQEAKAAKAVKITTDGTANRTEAEAPEDGRCVQVPDANNRIYGFSGVIGVSPLYWRRMGIEPKSIIRIEVGESGWGEDYPPGTILFVQTGLRYCDLKPGDNIFTRSAPGYVVLSVWKKQLGDAHLIRMDADKLKTRSRLIGRVLKKW